MSTPPRRVGHVWIVGGTHGNELTGIYLVQKLQRSPQLRSGYSFTVQTLLANPAAIAQGVRYIDQDLNRSFDRISSQLDPLSHARIPCEPIPDEPIPYEHQLAVKISQTLNFDPEAAELTVILDLHSSTANMGMTLIVDEFNPFNWQLAAHLSQRHPQLKLYNSAHAGRKRDALRSLSPVGLCLEVGPVAQGTLDARLFGQTEAMVYEILAYLDHYNHSPEIHSGDAQDPLLVYHYQNALDYPRDSQGRLRGMIHPRLQHQDYQPLHPGDPVFLTFDQDAIAYEGNRVVYPIFINEAAYYEKGIALCLTQPQLIDFKAAQSVRNAAAL